MNEEVVAFSLDSIRFLPHFGPTTLIFQIRKGDMIQIQTNDPRGRYAEIVLEGLIFGEEIEKFSFYSIQVHTD